MSSLCISLTSETNFFLFFIEVLVKKMGIRYLGCLLHNFDIEDFTFSYIICRGLRILTKECQAVKLFSKHLKIDDQVTFLYFIFLQLDG